MGEGNCGGGGSGDGGGDNGDDENGGGDDDNDGNDNGGSDNDNDGSDNNNKNKNGGNRDDGGGGRDTATAVGIDKEDTNQLKVAMDNGCGRPEAAVESCPPAPMVSCNVLVSFFLFCILQRMWLGNNAVVRKSFPRQKSSAPFLTWPVLL